MIRNGFIINPAEELKPDYKLSPFSTGDLIKNRDLPQSDKIGNYFDKRFGSGAWIITSSGREAIHIALSNYNLSKEDFVTIFTTSGNRYVSGCVTREIEKFCQWSMKIEEKSRIIFVIHEFGYPFNDLNLLKKYKLPIIEDCAYSFLSQDNNNETGKVGEYVIYSFPKFFPIQIGGLLVSETKEIKNRGMFIHEDSSRHIKKVLSYYIDSLDKISKTRRENYKYLRGLFDSIHLNQRFELTEQVIPGVFMFKAGGEINLTGLKEFLYAHGIESSVFYGENSFYIPVHQNLTENDLLYFFEAIKFFKTESDDNL